MHAPFEHSLSSPHCVALPSQSTTAVLSSEQTGHAPDPSSSPSSPFARGSGPHAEITSTPITANKLVRDTDLARHTTAGGAAEQRYFEIESVCSSSRCTQLLNGLRISRTRAA
jgi:hypothetical protein